MNFKSSNSVQEVFEKYPVNVREKMDVLRALVIDTAKEMESISELEETLKWGEPSYITKKGTTLRIDWKPKKPDQYGMFFQCTSMMLPTIKKVFGDELSYENNRAVIFKLKDDLPVEPLKECIRMAFTYHQHKHLPFLGK